MSKRADASGAAFWEDVDDAEALRRFRTLVNVIDDGICQFDAEGRFVAVNDVIVETTGYAREELIGSPASKLLDDDDASAVRRDIEREIQRQLSSDDDRNETLEISVRAADGDRVPCELRVNPLVEDGEFRGTIGVVRDVSERERVEQSLTEHRKREQELKRYETILEAIDDGVYVVDEDGTLVMVNGAYAEMTGYSREELVGSHASTVVAERVIEQVDERQAAGDGDDGSLSMEAELRTASGETLPVEATFATLPGDSTGHRVGVVRDVSERKERERTLRERERQLSTLMDNVPGMVYRCHNERGWPMEFVSDACREVTGYDPEAFERGEVSWGTDLILTDEDREMLWETIHSEAGEDGTFSATYRIETADGEVRWVRDYGRGIYDEDGDLVEVEGIISDVTERKRLETELEEILGRVTDAFYALDDQWRFTHVNDRARELIDYRGEGLVGKNFWDVFEWADDSKLGEEYREAIAAQEPTTFEFYYPEPLEAWYEIHAYPSETGLSVYFRDVTERRERERQLEESERRYRALVEHFPNGAVALVDEDLQYRTVGGKPREVADVSAGEIEDVTVREALPPELADELAPRYESALDGESHSFETEYDGRIFEFQVVPVRDDDGDVFAALGMSWDVTERRESQRKLAESERRYRTLVENFPNGAVGLFDENLRYTVAGGDVLDDIDLSPEEIVGMTVWERYPEEVAAQLEPKFEAALDGETNSFELQLHDRHWLAHTVPISDDEGDVFAGMIMVQDVTERTERERRLQRYREYTDEILNAIDDVFYLLDESGDLQRWNDAICEVTGYRRDEVESMHTLEFFAEGSHEKIANALREGFETGSVLVEAEVLTKGGDRIPFEFVASTVEDPDGNRALAGIGRDVTEQKERERYLRETKSQLEAATEAGAVGTWEWRIEEDRMVAGDTFAELFGVDAEAAREGVSLEEFLAAVHEDDRDRVEREIEEAVETCGEYEAEYRVWTDDGELRWVVARGHVECDEDGDPVTFPGAVTDITKRKRAETELEEHRRQLETLFEVLPVGVVVADEDGRLVEGNETAKEIWGGDVFDAESVADYERYRGWWADSGEPVEPDEWTIARVLRGEEVTEPDIFEIEATDGERRIIMAHGMPVREADGEVTRGVATLTDITERREYQRQLEESERRYRTLAENFPNGAVGVYDHDLRYTLVQGGMVGERLPPKNQVEGSRVPEIFPDDTVADLEPLFRGAVEDGETASTTTEFGGRNWQVWATPLRDADGDVFAGLSFAQDITEQVERERKLEATVEKLEESNERLESFASMLAHELRNPVTIGQIYSQQLPVGSDSNVEAANAEAESSAETDSSSEAVNYVTQAFDRMEDIIDVMLVLTRGQKAVGESDPLSVADVARDAWDGVDAPEATLSVDLDDVMRADETFVRHLFRNLFENAVQHGGADVTVTVGDLPEGFFVADDGTGIPAADRDTVFEAGYTTASGEGGTGLGLAFVEKLAEVYGWDCTVTESESGGARFEFRNVDLGSEK